MAFFMDKPACLVYRKKGETLYSPSMPLTKSVYFILYGKFEYFNEKMSEPFGMECTNGFSMGEEVLFEENTLERRYEKVRALTPACCIRVSTRQFRGMCDPSMGGNLRFKADQLLLREFLQQMYVMKSLWRQDASIIGDLPAEANERLRTAAADSVKPSIKNSLRRNISIRPRRLPALNGIRPLAHSSNLRTLLVNRSPAASRPVANRTPQHRKPPNMRTGSMSPASKRTNDSSRSLLQPVLAQGGRTRSPLVNRIAHAKFN